jgi:hypothetical protein
MRRIFSRRGCIILLVIIIIALVAFGRCTAYVNTASAITTTSTTVSANTSQASQAQAYSCPGALEPRLSVVHNGWVDENDPRSVNIRADAGTDSTKIGSLPVGRHFLVLDGPKCIAGMNWWQIRDNHTGKTGWISEGTDFYFVSPAE